MKTGYNPVSSLSTGHCVRLAGLPPADYTGRVTELAFPLRAATRLTGGRSVPPPPHMRPEF